LIDDVPSNRGVTDVKSPAIIDDNGFDGLDSLRASAGGKI
jgi:hypothetical protein